MKGNRPVKSKEGHVITNEKEQLERWKEHFEEILNAKDPPVLADIQPSDGVDMNIEPPTIKEIIKSIKVLNNGKAPGIDNIQAELLKTDVGTIANVFCHLCTNIWNREEIPTDWQKGIIIKLSKKEIKKSVKSGEE
ncbi:uncharacterized protein [Mytilus edulis]|uniref:uncharacterized protein n=1 Tax=Mytilus edulis TaxID=6550 RepID=UPI0039F0E0CE